MQIKLGEEGQIVIEDFSALQSYKIARKMEKDSIAFYQKQFDECAKEDMRKSIAFLIEGEKEHLRYFEEALESLSVNEDDGFAEDDLADFVDSGIFTPDLEKDLCGTQEAQVINVAYELEKRSIIFYHALLEHTHDEAAKKVLKDIIKEEKTHLETLKQFA